MKHGRVSSLLPNKSYYSFNSSDRHSWVLQELFPSLQPFFCPLKHSVAILTISVENLQLPQQHIIGSWFSDLYLSQLILKEQLTIANNGKAFNVHVLYIQCTYICDIYFIACIFSGNICCSINNRGKSFKGNIVWNKDRPKERGLHL